MNVVFDFMISHFNHGLKEVDAAVWRDILPSDSLRVTQDFLFGILV